MMVSQLRRFVVSQQVLATFLVLALGGCGSTPTDTPEPVAALEVNDAGEYVFEEESWRDEVVCKRQRLSGSHVPRKVCKTRGEIEDEREAVLDVLGPLAPTAGDELQRMQHY